jgi:hypothetical protein
MRTTLDIPDEIFRKAKLKAVEEGVTLKVVVARALQREVGGRGPSLAERRKRAERLFAAMDKARNKKPVGRLNRESLYDRPILRGH